jgi:hypothetical protein
MKLDSWWWSLASLLLCVAAAPEVRAYPNGAGSCIGGKAAVGGAHFLQSFVYSGYVSAGPMVITMAETALDASVLQELEVGVEYKIRVNSSSTYPYKGILIRVEAASSFVNLTQENLKPAWNTHAAIACEAPVVGITHVDNVEKNITSGILRMDQPGIVFMDITVVGINNATGSIFGWSRYLLNFLESNGEPQIAIAENDAGSTVPPPPPVDADEIATTEEKTHRSKKEKSAKKDDDDDEATVISNNAVDFLQEGYEDVAVPSLRPSTAPKTVPIKKVVSDMPSMSPTAMPNGAVKETKTWRTETVAPTDVVRNGKGYARRSVRTIP